MSVHKRNGGWQVKWRENGRQRSRQFTRKGDADTFDREIRRRLQLGPHLVRELARHAVTLDEFARSGFRAHAAQLAPGTRSHYRWALEHHLTELLDEPLIALDVPRLTAHQQHLLDNGRTIGTVREALADLSGILTVAVAHGVIPANPVHAMRKVALPPAPEVIALAPADLERMLAAATGADRAVILLGWHLGLRPGEIRKAPWSAIQGRSFVVGRTVAKLGAQRVIEIPAVTATELKAWRLRAGRPGDEQPIIGATTAAQLDNWSRSTMRPLADRLGVRQDIVTYTLRHSHASALHYAGFTPKEAADRMGHSLAVHVTTYTHVIESLRGKRYEDLDTLIAAARAEAAVPHTFPATAES